jgi:hypothetical protein
MPDINVLLQTFGGGDRRKAGMRVGGTSRQSIKFMLAIADGLV